MPGDIGYIEACNNKAANNCFDIRTAQLIDTLADKLVVPSVEKISNIDNMPNFGHDVPSACDSAFSTARLEPLKQIDVAILSFLIAPAVGIVIWKASLSMEFRFDQPCVMPIEGVLVGAAFEVAGDFNNESILFGLSPHRQFVILGRYSAVNRAGQYVPLYHTGPLNSDIYSHRINYFRHFFDCGVLDQKAMAYPEVNRRREGGISRAWTLRSSANRSWWR